MRLIRKACIILFLITGSLGLTACQANISPGSIFAQNRKDDLSNYVVYEAVFFDTEEILKVIEQIRGSSPVYERVPVSFHVTTTFLPDKDVRELYGTEVTVRVTGYKAGEVEEEDGRLTHNEGLAVEFSSDNDALNQYLESCSSLRRFHITVSYEHRAQYTNDLDFSDARKVDYQLTGKLGAYLNGNFVTYDASDVDTPIVTETAARIPFWAVELGFAALWLLQRIAAWIRKKRIDWKREACMVLMYINFAVIIRFVFFPVTLVDGKVFPLLFDPANVLPFRINILPLVKYFAYASKQAMLWDITRIAALFIPTGILMPVLWKKRRRFGRILTAGIGISLCIEILQLPISLWVSDIDDIIVYTLGILIGYGIWHIFRSTGKRAVVIEGEI